MTRSEILLGVLAVVALTLVSGVIHGRMNYRWGAPVDIAHDAAKLEQIPDKFGPWELVDSAELDGEIERTLQCAGYVVRNYKHQETGMQVSMFVLLGAPGPTAAHTPDICYSSQDFPTVEAKKRWDKLDLGERMHVFWGQTLDSVNLDQGLLRVYHAWSTGNEWQAPADARFAYASKRYLYKLQVAVPLLKMEDAETEEDMGCDFLKHFVPAAQPFLASPG